MAKQESVLSTEEKASFVIQKFIFHIIREEEFQPIYLDEIDLTEDQIVFFKNRFADVSEGTQHIFIDKDNSDFFENCFKLIEDPEKNFINMSKKLTASFKKLHNKNTNDGVFITSLVEVSGKTPLIFLLKLDHRKVYEYTIKDKKALLNEIKKTFVEDKKAIQKSALIDISDYYAWDVLATDRTARGEKPLRDYFSDYLTVIEKDTPSNLTKKAVTGIRKWALANKDDLNPNIDIATYKSRGIAYLKGTARFKTKDYIEAIVDDEDDERKKKLTKSLKAFCDGIGLSGQSFPPKQGSIDRAITKNIRRTAEGVKIEWEGTPNDNNIYIPGDRSKEDGLYHIVIKTNQIDVLDK